MLLTGAFLVDLCIEESGLGTRIGLMAIQRFGNKPITLILGFMTIAWALSMFCSNTSVCMMLMPFVLSIIERIDEANKDSNADDAKRFGKGALLGVACKCLLSSTYPSAMPSWFKFSTDVVFFPSFTYFAARRCKQYRRHGNHYWHPSQPGADRLHGR